MLDYDYILKETETTNGFVARYYYLDVLIYLFKIQATSLKKEGLKILCKIFDL